jgi:hypothetical protein
MSLNAAALSGFIGACTLTLIHETARRIVPNAPRMDVLGMRAIAKSLRKLDTQPPADDDLHRLALVGDVISNSLYYSLVGIAKPENALVPGALLGVGAGVGALLLPEPLGLGSAPSARTNETRVMTVLWYTAGGLAAALAYRALSRTSPR